MNIIVHSMDKSVAMNETGRSQLVFTRKDEPGLYAFIHLQRPHVTLQNPLAGLGVELYHHQLHCYLSIADFLLEHLDVYIIIKDSPNTRECFTKYGNFSSIWHYRYTANDSTGIGVDIGFIKNTEANEEAQLLSKLDAVFEIKKIPEDNLGDAVSHISIWGLRKERGGVLRKLLQEDEKPVLVNFLQRGELFMNLVVSKSEGYFHSMLIKSPTDLQKPIDAFLHVIVSDN